MGKTFVALGVAISVYLKEKRSTVIMIPPNLVDKWPNDFRLFCEACIEDEKIRAQLRCGIARRPEEFLRLLDDEESRRAAIIFLTHGALTRNMGDGWIKLAILQKALYRRHGVQDLYGSLNQHAGALIEKQSVTYKDRTGTIWERLLHSSPTKWRRLLGEIEDYGDDPVPMAFLKELEKLSSKEMENLFNQLWNELPRRHSVNIKERLSRIREILSKEARKIWSTCFTKIKHDLPLLIFDEAHHLKNSQTQLVTKLFQEPDTEMEAGILAGQFDRMLFLTATPFQLGHHELLNVLQRFTSINWESRYAPVMKVEEYKQFLNELLKKLDLSQIAARKLDLGWGKLKAGDIAIDGEKISDVFEWWRIALQADETSLSPLVQKVIDDFRLAKTKLRDVEPLLKKYVIRHLKPREMGFPFAGTLRRKNLPGNGIISETLENETNVTGLEIKNDTILPFLLAARLTTIQPDKRPVFAEGLASSFEAFRFTSAERKRKAKENLTDVDDEPTLIDNKQDPASMWYLEQLDTCLANPIYSGGQHPKLNPTIEKAIELWSNGEKVLIFCHYIETGKALWKYLGNAMKKRIVQEGSRKFKCDEDQVFVELEKIANRISSPDSPLNRIAITLLNNLIEEFPELDQINVEITEAMIRYMKTPSFLVRFSTESEEVNEGWLVDSFNSKDQSGISLMDMLRSFLKFLAHRSEDREDIVAALKSIQPGGIRSGDVAAAFEGDEQPDLSDNTVMANVRLCYGATRHETRQKLMKTFNTPFFPDILITSSVMAEGVDLHLNCRHIIHHDLSWNPSTLEQRTGRVDRIGAKSEKCGKSIYVYMPYLSETQDEKMYRVVTERERWFNIIMGEKYKVDAFTTDKYAERVPLPSELADELAFKLEVE